MRHLIMILLIIIIGATTSFAGECGDVDGTAGLNILDIVHLINYKYKDGPEPDCGMVTDIDGNVYQTVTIGAQEWMTENLKVMHYRNGDPIPNITDNAEWLGLSTGAYCNFDNDEHNVATYGRFYNWYAVDDSRNIAPEGWHVPTDEEWKQLEMYLGMSQADADAVLWRGAEGGKLKETGTTHWWSPNDDATNESGFTALPAGIRDNNNGTFYRMGNYAHIWSSSEYNSIGAWNRALRYTDSAIHRNYPNKQGGYSVRCVKN